MAAPTNSPYRLSDGERASPLPPVVPPQRLPLPNVVGYNGTEHSGTIAWPPANNVPVGETSNPGPANPFKNMR